MKLQLPMILRLNRPLMLVLSLMLLLFAYDLYPFFRLFESFLIIFFVTLPISFVIFKIILNAWDINRAIISFNAAFPTGKRTKGMLYGCAALTSVFLVMGAGISLNGILDQSAHEDHIVTVTQKSVKKSVSKSHGFQPKRSRYYAITPIFTGSPLPALKLSGLLLEIDKEEEFKLNQEQYDNLRINSSQLSVRVKKGFFGIAYDDGHDLVIEKLGKKI